MDKLYKSDKNNYNLTSIQKFYGRLLSFGQKNMNAKKLIRRNSSIEFTNINENDKLVSNGVHDDKYTLYGGFKSFFTKEIFEIKKQQQYSNEELQNSKSIQDQERRESNNSSKFLATEPNSKKKEIVKLKNLLTGLSDVDLLHQKAMAKCPCSTTRCMGSIMAIVDKNFKSKEEILTEAQDFINQFYASTKRLDSRTHKERLKEVEESINSTGSYELTETELSFGARTAWRNASRCIGRIQWSKLQVFDARFVTSARGMYEAICNHLRYATNKGNIRSAITVFRARSEKNKDFRVWNPQIITYAGYKLEDNTIIGDPVNIEFTQLCIQLGWKGNGTEFDVLPIVVQADGQNPEWYEIPEDLIHEVKITHPNYEWFKELNLKWYCVPAVSSMMLDVGGIQFTACPFNGWYMVTEIGRDLADINRYNKLPLIAIKMGLDIGTNASLWKDKALLELNYAILTSYQKANVTIVDHHSASESFLKHYENEKRLRGGCPGDWVWVVPPMSSHLTSVFHQELLNYNLKPSYEYQDPPWKTHEWTSNKEFNSQTTLRKKKVTFKEIAKAVKFSTKLMVKALAKRIKCTILYATETGKSENYAKLLCDIFKHAFDSKYVCMSEYDIANIEHETLLLIVTSTFGNGDAPEQAEEMKKYLIDLLKSTKGTIDDHDNNESFGPLMNVKFSVFALGNSSYPKFCAFGNFFDTIMSNLGAERLYEKGIGDELHEQEESFQKWATEAYKAAISHFCIQADANSLKGIEKCNQPQTRIVFNGNQSNFDLQESLSKWHKRSVSEFELLYRENLQSQDSGRKTLLVKLRNNDCLKYEPGDHIGIYASNRKELVESILDRVVRSTEDDQIIKIELMQEITSPFGANKTWIKDDKYPDFTLKQALTYFYDITTPLTQNSLLNLAKFAEDETEKITIENLAKNTQEYEKWKQEYYQNLAEILEQYPSIKLTTNFIIFNLPKLQPRFYSISSSPKMKSNEISITLLVIEYKPLKSNIIHFGVCSKFLDDLIIGETLYGFIRSASNFHMPNKKDTPIVMIGAGTGIAPFRSFWQENEYEKKINGISREMIQYFGCRNPNIDELYKQEMEYYKSKSIISEYCVAYSRLNKGQKIYVQHLLEKNSKSIFDTLINKNGHFYVCGGVQMAADVNNTLAKIICKHGSFESLDSALEFINELKEKNIFHEDIFGNH